MLRYSIIITIVLLLATGACGDSQAASSVGQWSLSGDVGLCLPLADSPAPGLLGSVSVAVGLGHSLELALGVSGCRFEARQELLLLPLSLRASTTLGRHLRLTTEGGLGPAFSDLPEWEMADAALGAHLGLGVAVWERRSISIGFKALYQTAATSTDNLHFLLLSLGVRLSL